MKPNYDSRLLPFRRRNALVGLASNASSNTCFTSRGAPALVQLRLTQHSDGPGRHRVEIAVEGEGVRRTAEVRFAFALAPEDEEDLRWYLEEYLLHPYEPARIVARIEQRISEIGVELFQKVFEADVVARRRWFEVSERLSELRVEIVTSAEAAVALPWELLRDPLTQAPLALSARAFVRTLPVTTRSPRLPEGESGPVRILLAICRPRGDRDVGFRSVASRLIKGLTEANRHAYHLEVLRPPTFEQLGSTLRAAQSQGRPFHVLHFDGHGGYLDLEAIAAAEHPGSVPNRLLRNLLDLSSDNFEPPTQHLAVRDLYPNPIRSGYHSYVVFEEPSRIFNQRLVDGPELGRILSESGVSTLVLNACRSAYAKQPESPKSEMPAKEKRGEEAAVVQARSWSTLAQEVMDAGVPAVVAMCYNLWVVTAAQFVADLYRELAQGATVGEAVTFGRKQLYQAPLRTVIYDPIPLQDWPVPIVYEAVPLRLFPNVEYSSEADLTIEITAGGSFQDGDDQDDELPAAPDTGFFGRDETLLALDRAFDRDNVVLLLAWAGSGKTSTAAEFARWYQATAGVCGPVLFSTFERYLPLPRLLDRIGQALEAALEKNGIDWLTLDDQQRRKVALTVLEQVPVLWIWDNVELVAGFPEGTESSWTRDEQAELLAFLRDLRPTQVKVLLTSRRDEHSWLGDLPTRIRVPPMREDESLLLVRALAAKRGRRLVDIQDWRPLLAFAQGNPMTLTVIAGEALRQGWATRDEVESYVAKLRAGEAAFPDNMEQGRARSLGASLAYGFEHAFTEGEKKVLALLHLFQGFVEVNALCVMGSQEAWWCLEEVRGMTNESGIELLDRAEELGHLKKVGRGCYTIHPALPWFFQTLFERMYPDGGEKEVRAYVEMNAELSGYSFLQYEEGNRGVINLLRFEEPNLLFALRLARSHGWRVAAIGIMQGLRTIYNHTGRRAEWRRLVEEIVPDFVDPETDGPRSGLEREWSLVTEYRAIVAEQERSWAEAARLQELVVAWNRKAAAPFIDAPLQVLSWEDRNTVRSFAASLYELALIRSKNDREDCMPVYREALALAERIGDSAAAAVCSFALGNAYEVQEGIRDLAEAERWYLKSLDLRDKEDNLGRGQCYRQLGAVAYRRFLDARDAGRPSEEVVAHLIEVERLYQKSLKLLPEDASEEQGAIHNYLGVAFDEKGDVDQALFHFRQSIRWSEQIEDRFSASVAYYNAARLLAKAGRKHDALEYGEAALSTLESLGAGAADGLERTRELMAWIHNFL